MVKCMYVCMCSICTSDIYHRCKYVYIICFIVLYDIYNFEAFCLYICMSVFMYVCTECTCVCLNMYKDDHSHDKIQSSCICHMKSLSLLCSYTLNKK